MKIFVVGKKTNKYMAFDNIREHFYIDEPHTGNNIDELNPYYCELTGLYYLWKNCKDDVVGLEHYRRYFVDGKRKLLSEEKINDILKSNDIICADFDSMLTRCTLEDRFNRPACSVGTMKLELKIIKDLMKIYHPEMYDDFEKYLKQKYHYQFNMFICKKELINEYCEFLFTMLKPISDKMLDKIKKRSIGFIGEILLFTFWVQQKKLLVYEVSPAVFK